MVRRDRVATILGVVVVAAATFVLLHQLMPRSIKAPPSSQVSEAERSPKTASPVRIAAGADGATCTISPDEIRSWGPREDLLVVDLRPRGEFERIRIPGSVNIPKGELKTKRYLGEKHLLLVDRGYRVRELDALCRSLCDRGFHSVRVLTGGLEAWRTQVGPLVGDGFAEAALDRVSPEDFESGLHWGDWTVIDVSETGGAITEQLGTAIDVPFKSGGAPFASRLSEAIAADAVHHGRFVVLVDRDGKQYAAIKQALSHRWPEFLYFLDGGLRAYGAARANHAAMLAAAAHPPCRECAR
jgi:rhodanese-related sulfurtransferase